MHIRRNAFVISIGALALIPLIPLIALAWTGPTQAPPSGNVAAPINVGTTDQVKSGGLGINSLAVFGNSLLGGSTGSNAYLNFGATAGTNGYGIRDNAGLLEFKNSSSTWQSLQSVLWTLCGGPCGGGGQWTTSGNNISNTNGGNVGIGTANPTDRLHVAGSISSTGTAGTHTANSARLDYCSNCGTGGGAASRISSIGFNATTLGEFSIFQYASNQAVYNVPFFINTAGNVGIGTGQTVSSGKLNIAFNGWANQGIIINDTGVNPNGNYLYFRMNGGVIGAVTASGIYNVVYNTSSDKRIKENIVPTVRVGLNTLMRLPVRDFSFKNDPAREMKTGFIAQELRSVFPDAVTTNGDNGRSPLAAGATPWQVDYGRVTPLLVKAMQEQQAEIESLKRDIEELRSALRTK